MTAAAKETPAPVHTGRSPRAQRLHILPRAPAHVSTQTPTLQRKAACACGGGCPSCQEGEALQLRPKLHVGHAFDPAEREADAVAERVMNMPPPAPPTSAGRAPVPRDLVRPSPLAPIVSPAPAPARASSSHATDAPRAVHDVLRTAGEPLDASARSFFEPRFGRDLGHVRVHSGREAADSARDVSARAYTVGSRIVFGAGEYAPATETGRLLLAHELAHTVQQGALAEPLVQRTTHGPETPTNCHNWTIPLPPWLAGTIAHGQIGHHLGIPSKGIPRATKLAMGKPTAAHLAPGFADLWRNDALVGVGEIKSTATGSAVAQREAMHYFNRHNEWLMRMPFWLSDVQDRAYSIQTGGPKGATTLDLSAVTGTSGLDLGAFWGDPGKKLFIEADNLGAVVYWCTGEGLFGSPIWLPIFREVIKKLKDDLKRAMEVLKPLIDGLVAAYHAAADELVAALTTVAGWLGQSAEWVTEHRQKIFWALVIVLCLIGIALLLFVIPTAPAAATAAAPAAPVALGGLLVAFASLMVLLGAASKELPQATSDLVASLDPDAGKRGATGAEYERDTDRRGVIQPASQAEAKRLVDRPHALVAESVFKLTKPELLIGSLGRLPKATPENVALVLDAADTLEKSGDAATARRVRGALRWAGLTT